MRSREKLYAELSLPKKQELRRVFLKNNDNFRSLAKDNDISYSTVKGWFRLKRKNIPIDFIDKCLKNEDMDLWDFLDKEKIKSQSSYSFVFNKELNIEDGFLLGWFISEGHISLDNKLSISQKNHKTLSKLKSVIEEGFNIKNCLRIRDNMDGTYVLCFPAVFRYYLIEFFGFKKGKKSNTVHLPDQLYNSAKEVKLAFLASFLEGDGSITYHKREYKDGLFYVPEIVFSTKSSNLKDGIYKLLKSLNYNPYIQYNKGYKSYSILLVRYFEIVKSFYEFKPYMMENKKIDKWKFLISQDRITNYLNKKFKLKDMKKGKELNLSLKGIIKKIK